MSINAIKNSFLRRSTASIMNTFTKTTKRLDSLVAAHQEQITHNQALMETLQENTDRRAADAANAMVTSSRLKAMMGISDDDDPSASAVA